MAGESDAPAVRPVQSRDRAQGGALARARGADEGETAARGHLELELDLDLAQRDAKRCFEHACAHACGPARIGVRASSFTDNSSAAETATRTAESASAAVKSRENVEKIASGTVSVIP